MLVNYVREILKQNIDVKYREFSKSLLPGIENVLGVRIPILRKIAKRFYREDKYLFLDYQCKYLEEFLLQGMMIGLIGEIKYVEPFISKINNWAVCDIFCSSLKFVKNSKQEMWYLILKKVSSQREYEVRFCLVMLLNYFVEERYLEEIFGILVDFNLDKYYAQMAAAWLISECCVKYFNQTLLFLKNNRLNDIVLKKAIQKIKDSLRISKGLKQQFLLEIKFTNI